MAVRGRRAWKRPRFPGQAMRHLSEFEGELRQLMEDDKGLVSAPEQP